MLSDRSPESEPEHSSESRMSTLTPEDKEVVYRRARVRAKAKMGFLIHAAVYTGMMALLMGINLVVTPKIFWVIWPMVGWGIGLALHGIFGLAFRDAYRSLEEREIARELDRLSEDDAS